MKTTKKEDIRILVADDNPLNQRVTVGLLRRLGYHVDLAMDGGEVLQKTEANRYSIIFMDVQMPDIDGYEATRQLRRLEEAGATRVPIIAVTAHSLMEEEERLREAGMDGFIQKPFTPEDLERAIEAFALQNG